MMLDSAIEFHHLQFCRYTPTTVLLHSTKMADSIDTQLYAFRDIVIELNKAVAARDDALEKLKIDHDILGLDAAMAQKRADESETRLSTLRREMSQLQSENQTLRRRMALIDGMLKADEEAVGLLHCGFRLDSADDTGPPSLDGHASSRIDAAFSFAKGEDAVTGTISPSSSVKVDDAGCSPGRQFSFVAGDDSGTLPGRAFSFTAGDDSGTIPPGGEFYFVICDHLVESPRSMSPVSADDDAVPSSSYVPS